MIEDVVPDDAWEHVPLTGERYLPWRSGWLRKSSLLLSLNKDLIWHGMEVVEVWSEYEERQSVGFDIVGSGRMPMAPSIMEDNAAYLESLDLNKLLKKPRRRHA